MTEVVVLVSVAKGVQISFRNGVCDATSILVLAPSADN